MIVSSDGGGGPRHELLELAAAAQRELTETDAGAAYRF
jgi:hypothetical protein